MHIVFVVNCSKDRATPITSNIDPVPVESQMQSGSKHSYGFGAYVLAFVAVTQYFPNVQTLLLFIIVKTYMIDSVAIFFPVVSFRPTMKVPLPMKGKVDSGK